MGTGTKCNLNRKGLIICRNRVCDLIAVDNSHLWLYMSIASGYTGIYFFVKAL